LTLKNQVGGTGPLTKVGDGVVELSGSNSYTGGTTIEAGTLLPEAPMPSATTLCGSTTGRRF
jgi:autotransporter-associated beta strand protein